MNASLTPQIFSWFERKKIIPYQNLDQVIAIFCNPSTCQIFSRRRNWEVLNPKLINILFKSYIQKFIPGHIKYFIGPYNTMEFFITYKITMAPVVRALKGSSFLNDFSCTILPAVKNSLSTPMTTIWDHLRFHCGIAEPDFV